MGSKHNKKRYFIVKYNFKPGGKYDELVELSKILNQNIKLHGKVHIGQKEEANSKKKLVNYIIKKVHLFTHMKIQNLILVFQLLS